jgi:hypothetical protein
MAESKMWAKVGAWAYVIGIVIAVLVAVFAQLETWSIVVLAVLGIIVGLLNITGKEVKLFLIASIAFVVATSQLGIVFNAVPYFFGRDGLVRLAQAIVIFTAAGALVVAFKALYHVAKSE